MMGTVTLSLTVTLQLLYVFIYVSGTTGKEQTLLPLDDLKKDFSLNLATSVVNTKIDRTVDVSSQLVKVTQKIIIENPTGASSPIKSYLLALDQKHSDNLAYLDVTLASVALKVHLIGTTIATNGAIVTLYEVDLSSKELSAGETLKQPLVTTMVFTHLLSNYPQEIAQNEKQLVKYQGYQNIISPYHTKTQTTKIKLPDGSKVESFSKATKQTTGTGKLTYGPFRDVASILFSTGRQGMETLECHYENNNPFVAVKRLQRSIYVSHLTGTISLVNEIDLAHVGAKLKGSFSRYDYQRDHSSGLNSVRAFLTRLPTDAYDIYYRDAIGNISTSDVRKTGSNTLITIRPRFPLFGGWITNYNLGYTLPAKQYLTKSLTSDEYKLKIPFADLLFENMVVDESVVKIILPEFTTNIRLEIPFEYERMPDEIGYYYLDTFGRPVIVLKKLNLVDHHIVGKPFVVLYNYEKMYLLYSYILHISAVLLPCLAIFVVFKLSSRSRSKSSNPEVKSMGKTQKQGEKIKNQ